MVQDDNCSDPQKSPITLVKPDLVDGSGQNLVHVAVTRGRNAFLSNTLIVKDEETVDEESKKNMYMEGLRRWVTS